MTKPSLQSKVEMSESYCNQSYAQNAQHVQEVWGFCSKSLQSQGWVLLKSSCLQPRPWSLLRRFKSWMMGDKRTVDGKIKKHPYLSSIPFQKHAHLTCKHTGAHKQKQAQGHKHVHVYADVHVHSNQDPTYKNTGRNTVGNDSTPLIRCTIFFLWPSFHLSISSVNCLLKVARRRSEPGIWKLALRDAF